MSDGIYLDEKDRLFSSKAPANDSVNTYTFWGNVNPELIFDRAYSLIIERDHELSLAIGSYFKGENFRPDDEFLIGLPEFFWMRFGVEFESLSEDLDQSLLHSSQLYRFFADFLQSPYSAEFLGIAIESNKQFSFESVYLRFKYGARS